MQHLIVYYSLQLKNQPHDGVANCAFILELGMVINKTFSCMNNANGREFPFDITFDTTSLTQR
jgi:hypothetical protein